MDFVKRVQKPYQKVQRRERGGQNCQNCVTSFMDDPNAV